MASAQSQYKQAIAGYLGIDASDVFLFWKGRVAFYALLKAFGIKEGDEIIIPAFTCVVVPNAIIYCGAVPVYVDIDPDTYNLNLNLVEQKITAKTKAIVAQNTFGLSPDLDALKHIAQKHNLILIEDCTHGFGGKYKGIYNGLHADASFFSTQWNKPFSTGIGGFAVVRNKKYSEAMQKLEGQAIKPGVKETLVLKILLSVYGFIRSPFVYWPAIKLYRWLSEKNLIVGSSQGEELEGTKMPSGFFKGMSNIQATCGIKKIAFLNKGNFIRIKNAGVYNKFLKSIHCPVPFEPNYATHTFLKYPLLVSNRNEFFASAEKNRIELGEWFLSPLHPVTKNFSRWNYTLNQCPVSEKVSAMMVNLPTGISDQNQARVISFLNKHKESIAKTIVEK